jgi:hypothetical protein
MSGYNKTTGLYELTWTKANHWLGSDDKPLDIQALSDVLTGAGIKVVSVHKTYLEISAKESDIRSALYRLRPRRGK